MRGWAALENLLQDMKYGARLLRRNPGFTAVAILSLSLGIGANTAIFQLLDALRLRSLPVKNPQELAQVRIAERKWASGSFHNRYSHLTYPQWEQIRSQQQAFSGIFAWGPESFNLSAGGEARYARGIWASGDFFQVLGVPAYLGRVFTAADDQRGCGAPGVVLSHAFWQREYGGQASAVGKKLTLENHSFEIIGVTPANFFGVEVGRSFDVAVPLCAEPAINGEYSRMDKRHHWWLTAMGRLKPGWTVAQAGAHLKTISPAIFEPTVPPVYGAEGAKHYLEYKLGAFPGESGFSTLRRDYETPLLMLLAITGLVLLICCANLANLMLARASTREREIAVRQALGASRGRLVRQLVAESLLLAIAGAGLGAVLARGLSRSLVAFLSTEGTTLFLNLNTDWRLFAFTAAMAIVTCVLFGLAPALRATRVPPQAAMKAGGRGLTEGRERHGLRRVLVVSQVAISLVLLVGALLFARSLRNLMTLDAGFRQDGILLANLDFTTLKLPAGQRLGFKQEILRRVRTMPGVDAAADANIVPLSGNGWNQNVIIRGEKKTSTSLARITPGYLKTLGTPLLAGRDFDDRDTGASARVAIVNEAFVRNFLPGSNPVGQTFRLQVYAGEPDPVYEIVGLVKDTKYYELRENFPPIAFVPTAQDEHPETDAQLLIRSNLPLADLLTSVKRTLGELNPAIVIDFHVFKTQIRETLLRERLMATLSGFFGFLAALLAIIGLYGVISYMVVRRRNEIGIRMALGADRVKIVRMILGEAGVLLATGLALGSALAVASAKTASAMLYGLHPEDPGTMVMAVAALAVVAAAASYLPAHRAAGLDPMVALRDE